MNATITDKLIDDLFTISKQILPNTAILHAKQRLLDYIGVTLAGVTILGKQGEDLADSLSEKKGIATLIAYQKKSSVYSAAFMNGFSAHVAELDDGERFSMMHPGAPVISALLAASEHHKLSWDDFLKGMILGFEAAIRIGRVMQPSLKEKGFHSTGISGTIGAAMATSFALKYDKKQVHAALAAAASAASGLLEVIDDGSQLKPFNPAHAAMSGLMAATVGKAAFIAPFDILGGNRGLIKTHSDTFDLSLLERNKSEHLRIENAYVKPYAACRHCHPAIESAERIMQDHGLNNDEIDKISVNTYRWAVGGHDHIEVPNPSSAKMSIPYSVAIMLATGKAGLNEFLPSQLQNPEASRLAQKVSVMEDDSFSSLFPGKRGAEVTITLKNTQEYKYRVDLPKGEPENPLTDEELETKYFELAEYGGWERSKSALVRDLIFQSTGSMDKLFTYL